MGINELTNEIVKYTKDSDLYDYRNCYNTDEEAFEDFHNLLKKSPDGILSELAGDITRLAIYEDLSDEETKKQFASAYNLIIKINKFKNSINIDKRSDIML